MTRRYALTALCLVAASALCVAMLELEIHRTHNTYFSFLSWNLFLAWVPLAAAVSAFVSARRGFDALVLPLLGMWLLFFPNAPYMVTDLIHLRSDAPAPLWYDALMLSAFAATGLMLGFASLHLVHAIARTRRGPVFGWLVVICALGLGSFGVVLGRFARFNSWDVLSRPYRLLDVVAAGVSNPFQHPELIAALLFMTVFLLAGYLVLYKCTGESPAGSRRSRS
jgi:uncharacterized membrane protein